MAKASGGTRMKSPDNVNLIGTGRNALLTGDYHDFYLPASTRKKLPDIEKITTYNELMSYLKKNGIDLESGNDSLSSEYGDTPTAPITKQVQMIAAAVETYKDLFGKQALKALKRVTLLDKDTPGQAAFVADVLDKKRSNGAETEVSAGTLRIKSFHTDCPEIFHEFAHVLQSSYAKKGEDLLMFSDRMVKQAHLSDKQKAYFGARNEHLQAERFAEAFAQGFSEGSKIGIDFIKSVRKELKK